MENKIKFPSLNPKTNPYLKDLAVKIELNNLKLANEVMILAHLVRPNNQFIKKNLERYHKLLNSSSGLKLLKMISSGELAIIPIGFRCYTRIKIRKYLGLEQLSFPFDNGFFSPSSVASVIKQPEINLHFDNSNLNHAVCINDGQYYDPIYGKGLRFQKSTYEEINARVISHDMDGINQYLDATYGYYTLDLNHNFILAHYNWHKYANVKHSKGIYDPRVNLDNLSKMLNRRIKRMFDVCNAAKYILFVFEEDQGFNHMMIDDMYFDISNLEVVDSAVKETFSASSFVVKFSDVDSSEKVLSMLK